VAALAMDDVDGAIDAGLLASNRCDGCTSGCSMSLAAARDERLAALAARERFRAREARLSRREQERMARRVPAAAATPSPLATLPPAAAAALQRALGKADGSGRK
jgi:hypothetical protein